MEREEKALKYALNILNRRDYTAFEMALKLQKKGFDDSIIEKTVQYLKRNKFINDSRYAENFVYFKLKNGYGKKRIGYDLQKRGIDSELVEKYLKNADEMKAAYEPFRAKYEQLKNDKNRKAKLFSFLARRGFEYDTINALLDKYEEG